MGIFVVSNVSIVRELVVLAQVLYGAPESWNVEYVPFINDVAPQYH